MTIDQITGQIEKLAHYPTKWARHADLIVHIIGLTFALFGGGVALGLAVSHGMVGKVAAVVIYAQMPGADASGVDALRRQRPAPRIVLGGPGWIASTVPSSARLVGSLGEALDEVLLAVHV